MADWALYRSRRIVFVKPHVNGKGEAEFRDKDGRTYPAETFNREWERQPSPNDNPKGDANP